MGGDYPLRMTSGHQRWSIHSIWITDDVLARTHQGRPFMFMNTADAKKRGIEDGDLVRVFNDFDEFKVHVKVTSAARSQEKLRPGQVMIYHAWEPYQFENWRSYDAAIPGMIKWLDLAAGYGHLRTITGGTGPPSPSTARFRSRSKRHEELGQGRPCAVARYAFFITSPQSGHRRSPSNKNCAGQYGLPSSSFHKVEYELRYQPEDRGEQYSGGHPRKRELGTHQRHFPYYHPMHADDRP